MIKIIIGGNSMVKAWHRTITVASKADFTCQWEILLAFQKVMGCTEQTFAGKCQILSNQVICLISHDF